MQEDDLLSSFNVEIKEGLDSLVRDPYPRLSASWVVCKVNPR
jgi:hypothetical protein